MAIPVILAGVALVTGAKGISSIENAAQKLNSAKELSKEAEEKHKLNMQYFKSKETEVSTFLDKVGKKELEIFSTFEKFTELIEKIHNKPIFKEYSNGDIKIPEYNPEKLKEISLGAGLLLSGAGAAAIGTLGGLAVTGATSTVISTLGVASTGTAISSLHGVAATNAMYAVMGGGSLTAGGAGMAGGVVVLGGASLGIGLLAGGFLFEKYAISTFEKTEESIKQMNKAAEEMNKICKHLDQLKLTATKFNGILALVNRIYKEHLEKLSAIINIKKDWLFFTDEEKLITQNTVLLVGLLYNLGKTKLLLKPEKEGELEIVNSENVKIAIEQTKIVLSEENLRKDETM